MAYEDAPSVGRGMLSEILGGAEPSPEFLADLGMRALRDAYNRTVGRESSVPGTAAPPSPEQTARVAQMRQPMQRPQQGMQAQRPPAPQAPAAPQPGNMGLVSRAGKARMNMDSLGGERRRLQRLQQRAQGEQQQPGLQRQNEMMRLQREQQMLGGGNRQVFGQGPFTPFDTSAQFGALGQRGV